MKRVLDLFCKAGGTSRGYADAGFEVVGIDIEPQPNYPYYFIQADAVAVLEGSNFLGQFDFIHASPPCQHYSAATWANGDPDNHPDLIPIVRELLEAQGVPFVIENVPGAPLINPITLCGEMFGLQVVRHRLFEIKGFEVSQPAHLAHRGKAGYGYAPRSERGEYYYTISGNYADHEGASEAMGIDWMTRKELAQAIPPAYTRYIGEAYLESD